MTVADVGKNEYFICKQNDALLFYKDVEGNIQYYHKIRKVWCFVNEAAYQPVGQVRIPTKTEVYKILNK